MQSTRGGRRSSFAAAAALAALLVSALVAGEAKADATTINIFYSSTALSVKLSTGQSIPSGGSIPAGSYQVLVYDQNDDMNPQFVMSGPGVSINSNLNSTGMGLDIPETFGPYTMNQGATYSVSDSNFGASSTQTFTMSASGSGGSGGSGGTSAGGGTTGGGTTSGGGGSSGGGGGTVGSTVKMLGTLTASLTSGKAGLKLSGKTVKTLKPGRYTFKVSGKSTLILGKKGGGTSKLKGSTTKTLTKGSWFVAATAKGPRFAFSVS